MAENTRKLNCAVYPRKSSEEGLEQDFNSLHAQREACEAFVQSQKHEGWRVDRTAYGDGLLEWHDGGARLTARAGERPRRTWIAFWEWGEGRIGGKALRCLVARLARQAKAFGRKRAGQRLLPRQPHNTPERRVANPVEGELERFTNGSGR